MKILITGGAGFIGSHVAEYYAKKGEDVKIIDNLSRGKTLGSLDETGEYNWNYLRKHFPKVKLVKGDISRSEDVRNAARDIDIIVHAAAQVSVITSIENPRLDFEDNLKGTFNILEAARTSKTNPVIIFCSTNKVYGTNVNRIPLKELETRYYFAEKEFSNGLPEDFPIDLCEHTPYGCSKLACDLYVQDYSYTYGLRTCVFRMSCIYGPRQFGVEAQGWVAWFVLATLFDRPITIFGDGKQVRDVLHVSDLVKAYDLFAEGKLKHEVFNIGGGPENTLSLIELLTMLKDFTGKKSRISFADWRHGDQKVYVSDISKAMNKLGWRPEVKPREGVKTLTEWAQSLQRS